MAGSELPAQTPISQPYARAEWGPSSRVSGCGARGADLISHPCSATGQLVELEKNTEPL